MEVVGVDGRRGAWVGALLEGRTVTLLALRDMAAVQRLADGRGECVGDGATGSRGRPMRICF